VNHRVLYKESDYPIFQNRIYDSANETINCQQGSIKIVEVLTTDLVFNEALSSELMVYDAHYQNKQAVSELFRKHLENVADIILASIGRTNVDKVGCGKAIFWYNLPLRNLTYLVLILLTREAIVELVEVTSSLG